ncbi:hypothetical protein AcW1_005553 [Taiwanofungus camphoratus]|nr:hypothetical protein AcW2_004322 [Antrodia cinnamomea]KAI0957030.1 hypothetical protein AcW1_005553 [Antrodia cinnamomea]
MLPTRGSRHDARRRMGKQTLSRSSSWLGSLKTIFSAPLSWLQSSGDFEDTPGKRRRNPQVAERDDREYDEGESRAKRKRVHSPELLVEVQQQQQRQQRQVPPTSGYLDVPEQLIPPPTAPPRVRQPIWHGRSASAIVPSSSRQQVRGVHDVRHDRHSHSPLALSFSQPAGLARMQSMDPPSRDAAFGPFPLSRDVSMESVGRAGARDVTMSPSRTPFHLRARESLTPQPSGQAFGPQPHRRSRDPSEPPPLVALMSNPVFVKPPPKQASMQTQALAQQPTMTLGSLVESQERSRSPLRQHSALLISRSGSMSDVPSSSGYFRPINAAEKALHDLDVYKTPLLPSRLRGSTTIPDMFKQKRLSTPVPMRRDRGDKPRLGMSKDKGKEDGSGKPYAGQSGMKKLLARRRMEEEEEHERERQAAIQDDSREEEQAETEREEARRAEPKSPEMQRRTQAPALSRLAVPDLSSIPATRRESSLRVGRSKASRNHPSPITRPKNKFSAVFDEDESEEQMLTSEETSTEEPQSKPSMFAPPADFSFAKDVAPLKLDTSNAKEPPIASLPFSLSKPSIPSVSDISSSATAKPIEEPAKSPTSVFVKLAQPPTVTVPTVTAGSAPGTSASAPPISHFEAMPTIALTPPTPRPPGASMSLVSSDSATRTALSSASVSAPPAATASIPNFFANSSIFTKSGVNVAPPAATTPVTAAVMSTFAGEKPKEGAGAVPLQVPSISILGDGPTKSTTNVERTASPFGHVARPASASVDVTGQPVSVYGASIATEGSKSVFGTTSTEPAPSPLGGTPATVAVQATTPTLASPELAEQPSNQPFSPGTPAKSSESSTPVSQSFGFGAPAKPAEVPTSASQLFNFRGTTKPVEPPTTLAPPFTFDKPAEPKSEVKAITSSEAPKSSLFVSAPSFGEFGVSSTSGTGAPKSVFSFGQPAATSTNVTATVEAPKPVFNTGTSGSFTFGQPTSSEPSEMPAPAKSPFTFNATPATPPVTSTEKPTFSFGPSSALAAPSSSDSILSNGSTGNGADVPSKPFIFGSSVEHTRSITPPRHDQEVRMDESPTRNNGMDVNGNGKQETLKVSTGFSFGTPSASAGVSPFGQNNQNGPAPFSFLNAGSSNPFGSKTEAKPESNQGTYQSISTSFAFGQKASETAQPPASPGIFGSSAPFTQTATPSSPAFSFGPSAAPGGPFAQTAGSSGSTPVSPSTFNAPAPFSFGTTPTSATAPSNPFGFGSQPASPASANAGLPTASGPSNTLFTFGQSSPATAQSPASTFGSAPSQPPSGGALFTIGSASAPSPTTGPGGRPTKKLPNRRGLKR